MNGDIIPFWALSTAINDQLSGPRGLVRRVVSSTGFDEPGGRGSA